MIVHPTQTHDLHLHRNRSFRRSAVGANKAIVSTGDVSNLNHIVFLLQENRAFDNYFGNLAYYRVNVDHIPGAQMSDVNDLHNSASRITPCRTRRDNLSALS